MVLPLVIFAADLFEGSEALKGGLLLPVVEVTAIVVHCRNLDCGDDFGVWVHQWFRRCSFGRIEKRERLKRRLQVLAVWRDRSGRVEGIFSSLIFFILEPRFLVCLPARVRI